MMGLPGAGKTTAAQIIEELTGAVRLSSDEARLMIWPQPTFSEGEHQELYEYLDEQTEQLLKAGRSVIYDANLNRLEHRQQKYDIAAQLNISVQLLVVRTPTVVAHQRAVLEADNQPTRVFGNLEEAVFNRLKQQIEWPDENEAYIELDGTKITPAYLKSKLNLA